MATVWAIFKFRHYLVGNTLEIYTDHYSLQWLRTMKAVDCTLLHWWRSELEEFNFVVKHKPGKSQKHVDALSWLPVNPEEGEEELGVCMVTQLPDHVQDELKEINLKTQ